MALKDAVILGVPEKLLKEWTVFLVQHLLLVLCSLVIDPGTGYFPLSGLFYKNKFVQKLTQHAGRQESQLPIFVP